MRKMGFSLPFAFELLASPRRGHRENVQPASEEAWAEYWEAERLWDALDRNPHFHITGYDWDVEIREPEPTYEWVWDETEDEYRERLKETNG